MAKKDLHTLIRIRKWDVEERQRALGLLLRDEERILEFQRKLAEALAAERAFVAKAPAEQGRTFEAYVQRCRMQREGLELALAALRVKIEEAREHLAEAFRRHKTFEITQEQRDAAEDKEFNRVEQITMDDMGIELHRRKTAML
ncbi:MAG: flagellar FliJ family protein [Rhodospirillaceae bacterium]|nr:flagellar FliJ family protein [Rhodospirillaceae bacterium]